MHISCVFDQPQTSLYFTMWSSKVKARNFFNQVSLVGNLDKSFKYLDPLVLK